MRDTSALADTVPDGPVMNTATSPIQVDYSATGTGVTPNGKPRVNASDEAMVIMRWSGGIIVLSLILLWMFGGIVFRSANI